MFIFTRGMLQYYGHIISRNDQPLKYRKNKMFANKRQFSEVRSQSSSFRRLEVKGRAHK